jgi:CRP/FNR family transcriptional regulator, nitrogen oxide reductase regulator
MTPRRKSPINLTTTEPQHCSIDLRLKILARLPFFSGLSPGALQSINQHFVEMGYQAGETIYTAGDAAERLFVVAEGKIKLLAHSAQGRSVLLDILASGEFFGNLAALGAAAYSDTAQTQTPACILSIRSDAFRQVLDAHPELALQALQIMADRLEAANRRVLQLSSLPVEKRIAFTLLELSKKVGRPQEGMLLLEVPLSREDLADMTGATPETVSRVMSQLQSSGIIASGRQWVGILDLQPLAEMAGAG